MRNFILLFLALYALPTFAQPPLTTETQPLPDWHTGSSTHQITARSGPEDCRPDSVLQYTFSTPTDSVFDSKTTWRYTDHDLVQYGYYGTPPELRVIDSLAYDALNRLVFQELHAFNMDSNRLLLNHRMILYPRGSTDTYDSLIIYERDFFTGLLVPNSRELYFYNTSNEFLERQVYVWNTFSENWILSYHDLHTYTPTGKVAQIKWENWDGVNWVPQISRLYIYNAHDTLTSLLSTNLVSNAPEYKTEYTYGEVEHTVLKQYFAWDTIAQQWTDQGYYLNDYDAQGRYEYYEYTYLNAGLLTGSRYEYIYTDNGDCPWFTRQSTLVGGENWTLTAKRYYFPNSIVAVQEPANVAVVWSVYPNPAGSQFWLEAPAGSAVQIVNLQGKCLYRGVAKGKERITLGGASGYVLISVGTGKAATSRLIQVGP